MVRPHIHVYPEIPTEAISEVWHAQKWRQDIARDCLSPMYDAGTCHYFVDEVARTKNGRFVIPIRWLKCQDQVLADAFKVIINSQVCAVFFNKDYI